MHYPLLFGLGPLEIGITVLVIVIMFGGDKMRGLAQGLGKSLKEINETKNTIKNDIQERMDDFNPLK